MSLWPEAVCERKGRSSSPPPAHMPGIHHLPTTSGRVGLNSCDRSPREKFARDSALEEARFEPSVPRKAPDTDAFQTEMFSTRVRLSGMLAWRIQRFATIIGRTHGR